MSSPMPPDDETRDLIRKVHASYRHINGLPECCMTCGSTDRARIGRKCWVNRDAWHGLSDPVEGEEMRAEKAEETE